MQVDTCIRDMVDTRGVKLVDLSRRLGRADSWARTVSRPGRTPSLSTVVDSADALGYDIGIIDRDTGAVIGTISPTDAAHEDSREDHTE